MLDIDGSYGEGGGQVLRTALALSSATMTPVKLRNVRGERDPPGLKPQHLAAVELLGDVADAEVEGASLGSEDVVFEPRGVDSGSYSVDVGTAGSTTLVAGAAVLAAAATEAELQLEVTGGTDVRWSPPIDYFEHVTLPLLEKAGVEADVEVLRRGHYPEGGGRIRVQVSDVDLQPLDITHRGELRGIQGRCHVSNLPGHITERMAEAARGTLAEEDVDVEIEELDEDADSTGTSIVLWAIYEETVLGASALGECGVPAEEVGETAACRLLEEMDADGTVDGYAADQLAPYLAVSGGEYHAPEVTSHLETCVWLCRRFLDAPELDGCVVHNRY